MDIIPYSPGSTLIPRTYSSDTITVLPPSPQGRLLPGQVQGVNITFLADPQFLLNKIRGWFADRDEVELADHGVSDKKGLPYIMIEWYEVEVDTLFLAILRDEEIIDDYTVYTRNLDL